MALLPYTDREPLTKEIFTMIVKQARLGAVLAGEPDYARGAAKVDDHTKCFWNTKGQRVTVSLNYGTFVLSTSMQPDETRPDPL